MARLSRVRPRPTRSENWKPVAGFENLYLVSDMGRIRSLPRTILRRNGQPMKIPGGILKPHRIKQGHYVVSLRDQNRSRVCYVHRLVLETFVGPCPDGKQCCHWDDDPANNWLENLRWDTAQANVQDSIRNGVSRRSNPCERNPSAKLTATSIARMRTLYATGSYSQNKLALEFGVSQQHVSLIVRGAAWSEQKGDPLTSTGRGDKAHLGGLATSRNRELMAKIGRKGAAVANRRFLKTNI